MSRTRGMTLVELLIVVTILAILAAVAIPSLLAARAAANEAGVVGDTRSVIAAESAFQSSSEGYYGQLACLSTPASAACIPGYGAQAPNFLDSTLATATQKSGYDRALTLSGTGSTPGTGKTFCYGSVPTTANLTGIRSFGGDNTGVVGANPGTATCCVNGALAMGTCPGIK